MLKSFFSCDVKKALNNFRKDSKNRHNFSMVFVKLLAVRNMMSISPSGLYMRIHLLLPSDLLDSTGIEWIEVNFV